MDSTPPAIPDKATLRRTLSEARRSLVPEERKVRSSRIAAAIKGLPAFKHAGIVCSYVSFREEVETGELLGELLAAGRRVAVPVHLHGAQQPLIFAEIRSTEELVPNHFGIPQPPGDTARYLPTASIPLFLVPGLAFDAAGRRLGYGLGFYDRAFAAAAPGALKVGLAFELQVIERVPADSHDVLLDLVVTEERVIPAARGAGDPTRRW
jgi:5-formyltetrahydrofolate cyclo-ligase